MIYQGYSATKQPHPVGATEASLTLTLVPIYGAPGVVADHIANHGA